MPIQKNPTATESKNPLPIGLRLALTLSGLVAVSSGMTQYLADKFHYQQALGSPLTGHFYNPFAWCIWQSQFESKAPKAFSETYLGVLALFLVFIGVRLYKQGANRTSKIQEGLHGTAHWALEKEIRNAGLLPQKKNQSLTGVYVGAWKDKHGKTHYLKHDGAEHVAAIAPTRSGKGVGLVIPTLLSWRHSAVIHDLKGELWGLTAGWRKHHALNKVLKFDPAAEEGSCRFNPLDEIRLGSGSEVADTQNLVTIIVDPDGKGLHDHWTKTAHAFLTGVILHLLYSFKDKTPGLYDVAFALSDPKDPISTLYDAMLNNTHLIDPLTGKPSIHPTVASAARDMLERPEQERGSVLSSAMSYLSLYRDPLVAKNTACSDFRIHDLMNNEQPVSLYLVVTPANKDRLKPLMRLMLNQIIRVLTREEMKFEHGAATQTYKHRLLLMLDEFPSFGRLEVFQEALAFLAGYGIKAYLIMQDISQLQAAYSQYESILSNCHIRVAYAPNKPETAKWLSSMAGTTTINNEVITTSGSRFGAMKHVNRSIHATARPLLTPDECMRLKAPMRDNKGNITEPGEMLIFTAGHSPVFGTQILYFQDGVFLRRSKVEAPTQSEIV